MSKKMKNGISKDEIIVYATCQAGYLPVSCNLQSKPAHGKALEVVLTALMHKRISRKILRRRKSDSIIRSHGIVRSGEISVLRDVLSLTS